MENMELYSKFRSVPEEAKKKISAGRLKGFTDINPMWRIKVLTEQFGPCGIGWYIDVTEKSIEAVGDEICAFVQINLFIKVDGEWSKPIVGLGGSKLATMERNGQFVSDEAFKMAFTDAISIACKNLGIAADVYFEKDRTKYTDDADANDSIITVNQVKVLEDEIPKHGQTIEAICDWQNVKNLRDLKTSQFIEIMDAMGVKR